MYKIIYLKDQKKALQLRALEPGDFFKLPSGRLAVVMSRNDLCPNCTDYNACTQQGNLLRVPTTQFGNAPRHHCNEIDTLVEQKNINLVELE